MNIRSLTTSCPSRLLGLAGLLIALALPASASAHTTQVCWATDGGTTTFYAASYHSPFQGPSPVGDIILDGFSYPFSGWIYASELPSDVDCWQCPGGLPGTVHYQTFTLAIPLDLHTISFDNSTVVQSPWCTFPAQTFGGDGACADADFDGICNDVDVCPLDAENDGDGDGICANVDNCPLDNNPSQTDANGNGQGDACEGVVCGNSLLQGAEECDDGNIAGGDGCSAICTLEVTDTDGDGVDDDADCAPTDASIFPGAVEVCDSVDNNCNSLVDEGFDADGDGFTTCAGDCNDSDDGTFPGATEECDGLDNDCDGAVPTDETDDDGDGQAECDGDCDDADAANFAGNAEVCDGGDNDCNGQDDVLGFDNSETDNDGDGQAECDGDCDDADDANFLGNAEACDGQDNNCLGDIDEGYPDFDADAIADCVDPDDDNDTVDDLDDECSETLVDDWSAGVPSRGTLGSNRWMYDAELDVDADGSFTQGASGNGNNNGNGNGNNQAAGWTYEDTAGCSCAQIIDELALGNGHTKWGCSNSAMEDWNAIVNP